MSFSGAENISLSVIVDCEMYSVENHLTGNYQYYSLKVCLLMNFNL